MFKHAFSFFANAMPLITLLGSTYKALYGSLLIANLTEKVQINFSANLAMYHVVHYLSLIGTVDVYFNRSSGLVRMQTLCQNYFCKLILST